MFRSCISCKAMASPDLQLQYCAACQSALYCSKACQTKDWRKQHKKLCKHINVGHGDMQVRATIHTSRSINLKQEQLEREGRVLDEEDKGFFKLFEESTFEGSLAAARKMKEIAKRLTKRDQIFLLFHSVHLLIHSESKMLSWPNSPLLVLLEFVDPNVLSGDEDARLQEGEEWVALLHDVVDYADSRDYSTHKNQLILAKQLIEHGANVNTVKSDGKTPLHSACHAVNVTNLDFVELLLKEGADPNFQDHRGLTPLMCATPYAPGAAKFLLSWPTTDVNITTRSGGGSFLALVRRAITAFPHEYAQISFPDIPYKFEQQFAIQQWRDIEEMLVEKGAHDSGFAAFG